MWTLSLGGRLGLSVVDDLGGCVVLAEEFRHGDGFVAVRAQSAHPGARARPLTVRAPLLAVNGT